jgi:hypothetical protein
MFSGRQHSRAIRLQQCFVVRFGSTASGYGGLRLHVADAVRFQCLFTSARPGRRDRASRRFLRYVASDIRLSYAAAGWSAYGLHRKGIYTDPTHILAFLQRKIRYGNFIAELAWSFLEVTSGFGIKL